MPSEIYPCGRFARRAFPPPVGGGFLGLALGGLWAEAGEIQDAIIGPASRQGQVGHLPVHVRRRQPHRHLRSQGQQVGGQAHRRRRLRRQPRRDEAAGDSLPAHLHALRQSGIPVSDWFPHVGGVIDEIAVVRSMWCHEGNHFPAVIETSHRPSRPAVRSSDLRELGLLRAGHRQQEPADVREHRPAVLAGAIDRRLPRRVGRGDAVPGGRNADPESLPAQRRIEPPSATGRCRCCKR